MTVWRTCPTPPAGVTGYVSDPAGVTGVASPVDDEAMTGHSGTRRWIVGVVLGVTVFALGVFLVKAGLEDADRWSSVIGLFLNIAGLTVTVISAVQARRSAPTDAGTVTNTLRGAEVDGPAVLARDVDQVSLAGTPPAANTSPAAQPPAGTVKNTVDNGRFHGPLIMGRDIRGMVLPPSDSPRPQGDGTTP